MIIYTDVYDSDGNMATTDVQSNELYLHTCCVDVQTALLKEPQPTHSLQSMHIYTNDFRVQTHTVWQKNPNLSPTNARTVIWQGSGQSYSCMQIFLDGFLCNLNNSHL